MTIDSRQPRSRNTFWSLTNILASQIGRRQLITILLVVSIPIVLLSINLYFNQRNNIIDEKVQELEGVAGVEEDLINTALENVESILILTANSRNVTLAMDVLSRIPDNEPSILAIQQTLDDIAGEGLLLEAAGTYDPDGNLIAGINIEELPTDEEVRESPEFAIGQLESHIGIAFYDEVEGEADFFASTPIQDASGNLLGVLFVVSSFENVDVLLHENIISNDVYLVSSDGFFLTDNNGFELGEQTEPASSQAIDEAINEQTGSGRYDNYQSVNVIGAYRWIPRYEMALVLETNTDDVIPSPTELLVDILPTIALSFVLAILLVAISVNGFVQPLIQITSIARRFSSGDLDSRVPPNTGYGELKSLSTTFNEMADQLQATVGGLESHVTARTRDLEAVVDVSTRIATILNVEQLLDDVTDLTKERFALYHAHIYLYNDEENRFVLTAGAGYVGEQMVAEKRSIDFNHPHSIVARAGREQKSVRVGDVTDAPDFLPHPLLPNTRSELAIPLIARGELLGVLDVQSDKILYFESDIQSTLEVLSVQISTALSNARLFANADRTSRHEQALGVITRSIEGATSVDDVLQTAVRELGKALRVPHTAIELQLAQASDGMDDEQN